MYMESKSVLYNKVNTCCWNFTHCGNLYGTNIFTPLINPVCHLALLKQLSSHSQSECIYGYVHENKSMLCCVTTMNPLYYSIYI